MKHGAAGLVLVGISISLFAQPAQQYPSQEDHDWIERHFLSVLDQIFPVEQRPGSSLGYRSYRDLHTEDLEYTFVFNRVPQERYISVTVRAPSEVSLNGQMMALHRKNPSAQIEEIIPLLKSNQWMLSEGICPAVKAQHDKFYRLALAMLSAKEKEEQAKGRVKIVLHPRVHLFRADISGGQIDLVLTDPEHPFVEWAEETRRDLEACIAIQRKPGDRPPVQ